MLLSDMLNINKKFAVFCLQFAVEANDQGTPQKTALANVEIQFVIDQPPTFDNLPRVQTISENAPNGSTVFTVQGHDPDLQVV